MAKKLYTTFKHKKRNKIIAKKRYKRKLRSKIKKNKIYEFDDYHKEILQKKHQGLEVVEPPKHFSFIENIEESVLFINKIEKRKKRGIYIDSHNIKTIDHSAIAVLLSLIMENRHVEGNFPKDEKVKSKLVNSGFLENLSLNPRDAVRYQAGKEKQIFTKAQKDVDADFARHIIAKTGETIWGEKRTLKGLQTILVELMHNTNNHADPKKKGSEYWWLSVNHEKNKKKVTFAFVDYGVGIFESLKRRVRILAKDFFKENHKTLRKILNGDIPRSATGKHFRGKGLPEIKNLDKENEISNLHIITNDVHANVSKDKYVKLNQNFSGTFVLWEVNKENKNLVWIKNTQ